MTTPEALGERVGAGRSRVARPFTSLSPRWRRRLATVIALGLVLAGAWLLGVRNLPLFAVESVQVEGADRSYAKRLERRLERAARGMTTLNVAEHTLEAAAARYPAVIGLRVEAELPDRLLVGVVERPPVAVVEAGTKRRVPVAADGAILTGQPIDRPLPRVPGRVRRSQARLDDAGARAAARVVAAAPPALAAGLERVRESRREGFVVELRRGPELRLGPPTALEAKWRAAAAVLASRPAEGARYIDLRLPDRPAAGGFAQPRRTRSEPRRSAADDASPPPPDNSQPVL
jgi:cell division protein FtsQ